MLWFESEMSSLVHDLNDMVPACGIILNSVEPSGERFWLAGKVDCSDYPLKVMPLPPHPVSAEFSASWLALGEQLLSLVFLLT